VRFVLFSDLHLDTSLTWAPLDAARRRRQALRDVLDRILQVADEVDADAVLCGGDLYEHERFTPDTAMFLCQTLGATHRQVVLAPGNHDWMGPESIYHQVSWSSNVHVFTEDRLQPLELDDGLTLWGAAHRAPANTDNFLDGFIVDRGGVNLALFHGSEQGSFLIQETGKRPHAPFRAQQIPNAGLDHAFLGHYHRPQAATHYTYPGNPDPLTFGEDGDRGAVVAEVAADGSVERRWRNVAATEAHDLEVDVTGCVSAQEIRERAKVLLAGCDGVARLTVKGELAPEIDLHPRSDLTLTALGLRGGLEALQVRVGRLTPGYDLAAVREEQTVRGAFVRDVEASDLDDDERRRVLTVGLRALEGRPDLEVE
jgi:DNA repair exonuclease SbcCD nuclease subunit